MAGCSTYHPCRVYDFEVTSDGEAVLSACSLDLPSSSMTAYSTLMSLDPHSPRIPSQKRCCHAQPHTIYVRNSHHSTVTRKGSPMTVPNAALLVSRISYPLRRPSELWPPMSPLDGGQLLPDFLYAGWPHVAKLRDAATDAQLFLGAVTDSKLHRLKVSVKPHPAVEWGDPPLAGQVHLPRWHAALHAWSRARPATATVCKGWRSAG